MHSLASDVFNPSRWNEFELRTSESNENRKTESGRNKKENYGKTSSVFLAFWNITRMLIMVTIGCSGWCNLWQDTTISKSIKTSSTCWVCLCASLAGLFRGSAPTKESWYTIGTQCHCDKDRRPLDAESSATCCSQQEPTDCAFCSEKFRSNPRRLIYKYEGTDFTMNGSTGETEIGHNSTKTQGLDLIKNITQAEMYLCWKA